jgi:flagellar assembly factor FliW
MRNLTLASGNSEATKVRSNLLGELNVRPADMLLFPAGMLGFPECRGFALLRGERDGLYWLQSMEYSTLTFLLVDPFMVDSTYSFDVQPSQILELGQADLVEVGLLAVVTLPADRTQPPTVNLQAPIVINFKTRCAKQLVTGEEQFSVRSPMDLSRLVA